MSHVEIWLIVFLLGGVTFSLRSSFVLGQDFFSEPPWLRKFLTYVPASVLAALIISGLVLRGGQVQFNLTDPRYPAAIIAGLVAWKTKNMLLTILVGMLTLWSVQWCYLTFL